MSGFNAGHFQSGVDPRRHQLTRAERMRGYATLLHGGRRGQLPGAILAWVWRRIRGYYRARQRRAS